MGNLSEMCPCASCRTKNRCDCVYGCEDYIIWTAVMRKKLWQYEDAEEQGRLVRLPCKRGDIVWRICGPKGRKFVAERTVSSITMYGPEDFEVFTNCFDWLGKTVFLTRQEAEKALKEAHQNG